ncbi:GlsB/YeaQ/YmgE family stress response membrane protein [Phyllobacterium phragmitis]|uniref:GlsB/YeaQ/YmgE family stress response membrane protein n=1 Tax=Phyllobacterium phragmitis TaxID=2670329 RepID=A0A2S9IP05_9HYPH|nr:GlsB/YeaQ/YmgE family stress response membrane protein [Phyllobacterium phragmitis]PRD42222.1 GlsB/YeaQ/YmgE family stress response membrane protein [Phyllobacterium phragmitis]
MNETQSLMNMPGVGFFGMLIIGFLAGYVAERSLKRNHGFLTNILVGIAGSFVGGALANVLNIQFYGFAGNLIVAIAGAIIILWIFGRLQSKNPQ